MSFSLHSRRWKRDQQKADMIRHGFHPASVYGGAPAPGLAPMPGPPPPPQLQGGSQFSYGLAGKPPAAGQFPVGGSNPTLEADRIRWAHMAEAAMNQNVYAVSLRG